MLKNTFRRIKLTQGKSVIVDADDFGWLSQWKWHYGGNYASRVERGKRIYMHRVINDTPAGYFTDHLNRDKLDNRKINLRTVTKSENGLNRDIQSNNRSGVTGVTWFERQKSWHTTLSVNGHRKFLGYFKTLDEARLARKRARSWSV